VPDGNVNLLIHAKPYGFYHEQLQLNLSAEKFLLFFSKELDVPVRLHTSAILA